MSILRLSVALREGQSYIAEQYASSPLKIIRPFKLADGRILIQLLNVGPGLMGGDCYRLQIDVQAGAKVVIINQSATKVHSMQAHQHANQQIHISVANDAELEYYPGLTIPYADSSFSQNLEVSLAKTARFATLERWAMGRIALAERFVFTRLSTRIRVYREDALAYADALELGSGSERFGLLEGFNYLAAGLWCWDGLPEAQGGQIVGRLELPADVFICERTSKDSAYVRAVAKDGLRLAQESQLFINRWRLKNGVEPLVLDRVASW